LDDIFEISILKLPFLSSKQIFLIFSLDRNSIQYNVSPLFFLSAGGSNTASDTLIPCAGTVISVLIFPPLSIILSFMDLSLLNNREGFRFHVIEALAREPVNYLAQFEFIDKQRKSHTTWAGGGILLPLYFREGRNPGGNTSGHYVFLLSKRSKNVQQPGDLCAPGGGIHPFLDSLLGKLLRFGLLPGIRGPGFALAKHRGKLIYEKILLLLGSALRESWEELRLSPLNVEFLGSLPAYHLRHRRWIIFPMVGSVKHCWKPNLNWEVERIVSIPLETFSHPAN